MVGLAVAADADTSTTLITVAMQDEARKLPSDITASLSRTDRRVRFELVKLAGNTNESLAGVSVTVIDPMGESKQITTDTAGSATLENAEPGLYAVVVAGPQGHSTLPLAVREADPAAERATPAAVRLPLVSVEPREIYSLASSARPTSGSAKYSDIDRDFVSDAPLGLAFGYRVRLSSDGILYGQVLSLVRGGIASADVAGTRILIYSGSAPAGQAIADADGFFEIPNVAPGVYGLVAAGSAGYAAFSFEAYARQSVAGRDDDRPFTLVSLVNNQIEDAERIPVVLVPPPMVEQAVGAIELGYGPLLGGGLGAEPSGLGNLAAAGLAATGGIGNAGGGGSAGGSGGFGGVGLAGLAAPLAIGLSDAFDDDNDEPGNNISESTFTPPNVPSSEEPIIDEPIIDDPGFDNSDSGGFGVGA